MELTDEIITFYVGLCWHCKAPGSTLQPLQRCGGCQLVAYCSKSCQKDDRCYHKYICKEFPVVDGKNVLYTTGPWEEHIAGLLERAARLPKADDVTTAKTIFLSPWVCNTCHEARRDLLTVCKCAGVSYCSERCSHADISHTKECSKLGGLIKKCSIDYRRLSYPHSLLYALQLHSENYNLCDDIPMVDLPSAVVHIITSNSLLDSVMLNEGYMRLIWEQGFAHHFPKLKQLHLVFIMQGKAKPSFHIDYQKRGCEDCETNGRVITYSLIQTKYHMFFSSENYTKPDIVAVYGNTQEMSASEEEAIHSEISYRNMAYSHDTLVVLMDATKDLVKQGVVAMNAAQPIYLLLGPKINTFRGFTLNPADSNEKNYIACLKRE